MSAAAPSLRVISFGDLDGQVWGCAIDAGEPAIVFATSQGQGSAVGAGAVSLTANPHGWELAGDGFELQVTPADREEGQPPGAAGLCLVQGTLEVAAEQRPVQCVGTLSDGTAVGAGRLDSARGVSGWFGCDRGLALLALRPTGASGQESDLIAATVFEPDGWIAVHDPRLSTTFRPGQRPSRASLELWIGDGEEQYPRRAAAEASGEPAAVRGDGVSLQVTPLRCHTGGLDGAGVYVLARF